MKTNKGITLVALVITIIVLLILAGVSISLVVGDNGVLTQASTASEKTAVSQAKEAVEQTIAGMQGKFSTEDWPNNTTHGFVTNYLDQTKFDTAFGSDNINKYGVAVSGVKKVTVAAVSGSTTKKTITINVNGVNYVATVTEAANKIGSTITWDK